MQHDDSRPVVRRARAWRTARALVVVSALILAGAPGATSDDGLPPSKGGLKGKVLSTGLGQAAPAKQFYRVPLTALWAADIQTSGRDAVATTYAISPPGSPHPYGYFPPVVVRTLAFGIVPAEATIALAQLREKVPDVDTGTPDKDGAKLEDVPVAWLLTGPAITTGEHTLVGKADLRIAKLVLDGVAVPVGPKCRTRTPAQVMLRGQPGYVPTGGGTLAGTVDVPAFSGCGMNGEDLSPLITSMVSGTGNTLEVKQSDIAMAYPEPNNTPGPFPLPER